MAIPRVLCRFGLLLNNDFSVITKYSTIINSVHINKSVYIETIRQCRMNFSTGVVLTGSHNPPKEDLQHDVSHQHRESSTSSSSSSSESDSDDDDEVTVVYHRGLPQITVPLPSRNERCRFTLKPISNTVGDFLEMLKKEDKGIDRVVCKANDGTRIASSNTIENLLEEDFKLVINDTSYSVNAPKHERLSSEEIKKLGDVKNLVNNLYEALHVKEHQLQKEVELRCQLEVLQQELCPLEDKRNELELVAQKKSNWLAWAGLGLMSVQFGILARLTWWEYSWDIMEPVTYFVTYGTAMAAYAYFVLTREEYILQDVRHRQHLLTLHKKAKKQGLDLMKYNTVKDQIYKVELELSKLRDPLRLILPPKPATTTTTETTPPGQPQPSSPAQALANIVTKLPGKQ